MSYLRLKEALQEKGMTGKDLASAVGVSVNTISLISTGTTQPRFELLESIAEVLDLDIRDLFNPTKTERMEHLYVFRDGKYILTGNLIKSINTKGKK